MHKMIVALLLLCIGTPAVATGEDPPRLKITVFRYIGMNERENSYNDLVMRRLKEKVDDIKREFADSTYIKGLFVERGIREPRSYEEFVDQAKALQAFTGAMDQSRLHTTIYLCKLRGSLPKEKVTISTKIAMAEYQELRDLYKMVTLYALAMDAKRLHKTAEAIRFLQKANSLSYGRNVSKGDDTAMLIRAIKTELKNLSGKG
ncbi:hypothetical protein [Geotalea toluenoxydans]